MASRLARAHPANRTVFALEGGYDLDGLRHSARSTVLGISGVEEFGPSLSSPPFSAGALEEAAMAISRHWKV
jgi:acetoin utilization deacetylase AcuC-like enzyme